MKKIALFGAGAQGRTALAVYKSEGNDVSCFIDNDAAKQGTDVLGIPVFSLEQFLARQDGEEVVVSVGGRAGQEILKQLERTGIIDGKLFNKEILLRKERFLSYSYPTENEDLILYHVLKDENNIFWIDVGCNDPDIGSVTRVFYERGGHGINIDIEKGMMEITKKERPRDINIHAGIGSKEGEAEFYSQGDWGGLSTMIEKNIQYDSAEVQKVSITTLKSICDRYIHNEVISFLKIDVEGMERDVLLGMDFEKYRPLILVVESTVPCTNISDYAKWENIVLENNYHFAYQHGINRYYVANESSQLDERFVPWEELAGQYCVLHTDLLYVV